jgi:hypothetical protein
MSVLSTLDFSADSAGRVKWAVAVVKLEAGAALGRSLPLAHGEHTRSAAADNGRGPDIADNFCGHRRHVSNDLPANQPQKDDEQKDRRQKDEGRVDGRAEDGGSRS